MKIVIIDNYDSFTYNLSHLVKELGAEVTVLRNDQFRLDELETFDKIILSPGPGIPSEAGLLCDVIRAYAGRTPILGVCLGHQAIGEVFGGRLENLSEVFHGVATPCHILGGTLFKGLPADITIGRACLEVTAVSDETSGMRQIMALQHREWPVFGIQFHPESVLTPEGKTIIKNFIDL